MPIRSATRRASSTAERQQQASTRSTGPSESPRGLDRLLEDREPAADLGVGRARALAAAGGGRRPRSLAGAAQLAGRALVGQTAVEQLPGLAQQRDVLLAEDPVAVVAGPAGVL